MSELRDVAVSYLARGWSVVPAHTPETTADGVGCSCHKPACSSPGKHPRVAWTQYQKVRASQGEVETWWTKWPNANIIVITGAISGVDVVDIDPRHGGDDSLHDLHLPETLTDLTGGGGQHLWYQHPGVTIRNAAGVLPGIDFRGDGGYVIAPPSRHASGRLYTWEVGSPDEPAPFPDELRAVLENRTAPVGDPGLPSSVARTFDLTSILARRIPHGERDDTLAQIAGHFAGQGMELAELTLCLKGINAEYCITADKRGLDPLPLEDVERIARSIWERERRKREDTARVEEALTKRRNGGGGAEIAEDDRVAMGRKAWGDLGIPGGAELVITRGHPDQLRLYLLDRDVEVPLGSDPLNFRAIRAAVLIRTGSLLNISAKDWPAMARVLVGLARQEEAEPILEHDRVDEWMESFASGIGLRNVPPEARRAALAEGPIMYEDRRCLVVGALRKHLEHVFGERLSAAEICQALKAAGWQRGVVKVPTSTLSVWLEGSRPLNR